MAREIWKGEYEISIIQQISLGKSSSLGMTVDNVAEGAANVLVAKNDGIVATCLQR